MKIIMTMVIVIIILNMMIIILKRRIRYFKVLSLRPCNTRLPSSGVWLCLMGRRDHLALVGSPSINGVSIKTLVVVQPEIY